MMFPDADDPMFEQLRLLRPLSPDAARAERVRARCRTRLDCTRKAERSAAIADFTRSLLAPMVFACVGGLYMVGLVRLALRLQGLFE